MPVKLSTFRLVAVLSAAVANGIVAGHKDPTKEAREYHKYQRKQARAWEKYERKRPTAGTLAVAAYIDMDGEPRTAHPAVL